MRSPGPLVSHSMGIRLGFHSWCQSAVPWFRPNKSNPGWHPSSLQGRFTIGVIVAAVVTVVVLFRTGVL
jgi:hypothetical protein